VNIVSTFLYQQRLGSFFIYLNLSLGKTILVEERILQKCNWFCILDDVCSLFL